MRYRIEYDNFYDRFGVWDNLKNELIDLGDFVDHVNDMMKFMESIGADYDYEKDWKGKQNVLKNEED